MDEKKIEIEAAAWSLMLDFGGPGPGQTMELVRYLNMDANRLGISPTRMFNEYEAVCERVGVIGRPGSIYGPRTERVEVGA